MGGDAPSGYNPLRRSRGLNFEQDAYDDAAGWQSGVCDPLLAHPRRMSAEHGMVHGLELRRGRKRARMTSPTNGSTLSSATTNFAWDGGTNVTGCALTWQQSGSYDPWEEPQPCRRTATST